MALVLACAAIEYGVIPIIHQLVFRRIYRVRFGPCLAVGYSQRNAPILGTLALQRRALAPGAAGLAFLRTAEAEYGDQGQNDEACRKQDRRSHSTWSCTALPNFWSERTSDSAGALYRIRAPPLFFPPVLQERHGRLHGR